MCCTANVPVLSVQVKSTCCSAACASKFWYSSLAGLFSMTVVLLAEWNTPLWCSAKHCQCIWVECSCHMADYKPEWANAVLWLVVGFHAIVAEDQNCCFFLLKLLYLVNKCLMPLPLKWVLPVWSAGFLLDKSLGSFTWSVVRISKSRLYVYFAELSIWGSSTWPDKPFSSCYCPSILLIVWLCSRMKPLLQWFPGVL